MTDTSIPAETRIGHVHLKVADLERAIGFYRDYLGFDLLFNMGSAAFLSAGGYHHHIGLNTWESKDGSPPPPGTTGLFHVAIRYPSRKALAKALKRLVDNRIPISGASDHGVSEAIYLNDPDGNGIELYRDRPHSTWRWHNGQIAMATEALEFDNLLATIADEPATTELLPQTDIGHIHLHVAGLSA